MGKTPVSERIGQEMLSEITMLRARVTELEMLVKLYETQLLLARRKQFGSSSEKADGDLRQMSLFGEADAAAVPEESETEEVSYRRKKRKGKREEDLSGLPVVRVDYQLAEEERRCPCCGETMRDIGVDVRRELELIPAKVVVKGHAAHAYACVRCERKGGDAPVPVIRAKGPRPLLSGSLASASLVDHIAVQKYQNGMPLYRLEKGFAYDGVVVSRQNMSGWVIQCSETYLEAIYGSDLRPTQRAIAYRKRVARG